MSQSIEVIFDGQVLRPTAPPNLPLNTPLRVTIETPPPAQTNGPASDPYAFLEIARNANCEGPADWSANVDKYLHDPGSRT
jgi:hypothetical protein